LFGVVQYDFCLCVCLFLFFVFFILVIQSLDKIQAFIVVVSTFLVCSKSMYYFSLTDLMWLILTVKLT
jgi:hypothetical protein